MADQQTIEPTSDGSTKDEGAIKAEAVARNSTEPKGAKSSRSYRVLMADAGEPGQELIWLDQGFHPGTSQESAIKRCRQGNPEVRKALSEKRAIVAVPESYFEPLTLTVETIEVESFKKATEV